MFGLGMPELIVILVIIVLVFGVGKVSDIGSALGKSIRGFKKALNEPDESETKSTETDKDKADSSK